MKNGTTEITEYTEFKIRFFGAFGVFGGSRIILALRSLKTETDPEMAKGIQS